MKYFFKGIIVLIVFAPLAIISIFQMLGGCEIVETPIAKFINKFTGEEND